MMDSYRLNGRTRVTGIIGWPVEHSLSPALHNAAYAALGLDYVYVPFAVPPDALAAAMAGVRALGVAGLNVTIPHKVAVAAHLDALSHEAKLAGAVNTIVRLPDGSLLGHNTDGAGFLAALAAEAAFAPAGKRVVILGAGGAARAVVQRLGAEGARSLLVVNRDPVRSRELCEHLGPHLSETTVGAAGREDASLPDAFAQADLLVNCTSVGMHDDHFVPPLPLASLPPHAVVADVVYRPAGETPLIRSARALGLCAHGGLGMLVHQAALAEAAWTGVLPPVEILFEAARAART